MKAPMIRSTGCSAAIGFMLCCAVAALSGDAFAASPELVEFEGAPQPALERGELAPPTPLLEVADDGLRAAVNAKVKLQCQPGPFSWWGKVVQYLASCP